MLVLCLGDIHIKNDNVEECNVYFSELEKYLDSHDIDLIIVLGDTLNNHQKVDALCLKRAVDYLYLLTKYTDTIIILGNHDVCNPNVFLTENHWLYGFKTLGTTTKHKLTIVDKPILEKFGDIRLVFSPYVPEGKLVEALNTIPNWQNCNAVFCHQTIDGAKFGAITVENVEQWEPEYPLSISGHIHIPQCIANAPKNPHYKGHFIYVGSIFNSQGDTSKKRLLLADINNICINLKDIHLNLLQKSTLKINYTEINEFDYTEYKNTKLKLIINFDSAETWKNFKKSIKYKEITNYGIKIDPNINIDNIQHIKTKANNFNDILNELVISTNNNNVKNIYKNLLLNKIDIFDSDIIEL